MLPKPLASRSFETVEPIQSQNKKPNKKNTKTILQQSAVLNDTDINDNDDFYENSIPQDRFSFYTYLVTIE